MLRVRPDRAPPGSTLAAPIYHPQQRGTVLLATGTKLEAGTLDRLARFGCESIWIKIDKLKPIEEFHSDDIRAARERLAADLDSAFRSLVRSKSPEFNADAVRPSVERLIAAVGARPNAGLLIHELSLTKPGLVRHCANVAYLSALLGQRLDFYLIRERPKLPSSSARDPLPLVMAGALHDIGMLAVPPQVRERVRQSGDEEDTEWRVHAGIGFAMLKGRVDPAIATAVLNHHQAFDGSGFPPKRGGHGETIPLAGSGIHVLARIVACCEQFERARFPSDERPPIASIDALNALLTEPLANKIDPIVRTALFGAVPPFPPGTVVTLSDAIDAVVMSWRASDPCRPVVATLDSVLSEEASLERVDLAEEGGLSITHHEGRDVRERLFDASVLQTERRGPPKDTDLGDAA